jgi:inosine/xanthosine triphosphate pyrophosphatase family protein
MKLLTSNPSKLAEFARFGVKIEIAAGPDLAEVDGTPDEVILHKSLAAGPGTVVEDTILIIDGKEVVDIRWKISELTDSANARWMVSLGYNDGNSIHVYRAFIDGTIRADVVVPDDAFGFDPYFFPGVAHQSLYDLNKVGLKDLFSARSFAIQDLRDDIPDFSVKISNIPAWTGKYQNK